ncbi:MAG: hypothetical protein J0I32_10880 [Sphingobacteriales bacterium]|nr:hypothetical protein [Sphingobacteriales bacterium]OJW01214.1 MAG: hypothetical protein BGO52_07215 [Sphingobacteriales bacterium 44-61]
MKPANQQEIMLYTRMGEAICQIQILEQALTHCLTLKLNPDVAESEANNFLLQQQQKTFGTAVRLAAKKGAYPEELQKSLEELLDQRNWLVHHAMRDSQQGNRIVVMESILKKVKSITDKAEKLQQLLEWDLIDFSASKGRNVSRLIEMMIREKGPRPVGI